MENKEDLKIKIPNTENPDQQELSDGIKEILEEQQAKGNIEFKMERFRKCDFCQRRLEEGDEFVSLPQENGDVLDKCVECQRDGR